MANLEEVVVKSKPSLRRYIETACLVLVGLFMIVNLPEPSRAGGASDQVRQSVEAVLRIVRGQEISGASAIQRRDELRKIIAARFDFGEMSKRALGAEWRRRTTEEQSEFAQLFAGLLENAYLKQIEAIKHEQVTFGRERIDGKAAEVETSVLTKENKELSIDYRLISTNGQWRVYDVVIEDVSLVNNYRSQFNRLLAKMPFDQLLRDLRARQTVAG